MEGSTGAHENVFQGLSGLITSKQTPLLKGSTLSHLCTEDQVTTHSRQTHSNYIRNQSQVQNNFLSGHDQYLEGAVVFDLVVIVMWLVITEYLNLSGHY